MLEKIENTTKEEFLERYNRIISRGLSKGVGDENGQMCIEAAICVSLGLPHGDDPKCVSDVIRSYKININDANWSSPLARANALRDIGIAQLGSKGTVDGTQFAKKLVELHIKVFVPELFRVIFVGNEKLLTLADKCEVKPTVGNCRMAANAANAAATAYAVANASYAAANASYAAANAAATAYAVANASYAAANAANVDADYAAVDAVDVVAYAAANAAAAAAYAANAAAKTINNRDYFLILNVNLAMQVLRELKSPGLGWLES